MSPNPEVRTKVKGNLISEKGELTLSIDEDCTSILTSQRFNAKIEKSTHHFGNKSMPNSPRRIFSARQKPAIESLSDIDMANLVNLPET